MDRKRAACRVCHVTLKYSDNTANMIDHTLTTIAIILRLLFCYRDSIAIVKSPAIVTPTRRQMNYGTDPALWRTHLDVGACLRHHDADVL